MNRLKYFLLLPIFFVSLHANAQEGNSVEPELTSISLDSLDNASIDSSRLLVNYKEAKTYTLGGFRVLGTQYLDKNVVRSISNLYVGQPIDIPGDDIAKALKNLWKQGLFSDMEFRLDGVKDDKVFITLSVVEKPRMSNFFFKGIKKGQSEDISKKITSLKGRPITESLKSNIYNEVADFYREKGYMNPKVNFVVRQDTFALNTASVYINVDKGSKVKIAAIEWEGVNEADISKVRKSMKETKGKTYVKLIQPDDKNFFKGNRLKNTLYTLGNLNIASVKDFMKERVRITLFKGTKFNEDKFEADKKALIEYYNTIGYRDARIVFDTVKQESASTVRIKMKIDEGNKYYFRNISFKGNAKYTSEQLSRILDIEKGDVFNASLLQKKISMDPNGADISSLYYDDGYLFFQADPNEIAVGTDSIDLEIRITEGPQATIKNVIIEGNDKTNEHVIRRELRTLPGQKFSRTDLIRSQREIANLGYFDPQATQVVPIPNPEDGTVDIKYTVTEKSADQIELSAGWGGSQGIIGTLGLSFNNFSLRNIPNKKAWSPLPTGDGQKLSIRMQSNGKRYQTYNISFTEPWLGGKKPNALSLSAFRSRFQLIDGANSVVGRQITNGASIGLGTRLKWPDDFFIFQASLNYQNYQLVNFSQRIFSDNATIENGSFNNINLRLSLSRNSIDQPLYPTNGSNFSLVGQFTPPYSLFRKDGYFDESLSIEDKYKWVEYHKWRITVDWFQALDKKNKFVLRLAAKFGFIGYYNKESGLSPFERFQVGGNGLPSNIVLFGQDIISQRGYGIYSDQGGDAIFNKLTMELRYPFSLNPSATIYGIAFAEAGNSWRSFSTYNPYRLNKTVGIGIRAFLPMFGLLGVDYGIRFDQPNNDTDNRIQSAKGFFDYISKNGMFTIILGFEPE